MAMPPQIARLTDIIEAVELILLAADLQAVSEWIRLNEAALVAYWDCQIDTAELMQRLRPLSPPVPP